MLWEHREGTPKPRLKGVEKEGLSQVKEQERILQAEGREVRAYLGNCK